jgi:hypothetical protein
MNPMCVQHAESMVVYWVVQRDAQNGALIAFKSFARYAAAEKRKAQLEVIADSLDRMRMPAIDMLPSGCIPKIKPVSSIRSGARFS